MANRRMFSLDVTDTDKFLDLPCDAQLLYYHLGMRADDDGFIGMAKRLCRMIGIESDNLNILTKEGFLMEFPEGVYVITEWKRNNYLQRDRYRTTVYQEYFQMLGVDKNSRYFLLTEPCIHSVSNMYTQDRLGKDRLGKDRLGEDRLGEDRLGEDRLGESEEREETADPPALDTNIKNNSYKTYGEYSNVSLADGEVEILSQEYPDKYKEYIEKLSAYIASTGKAYNSHFATIRRWLTQDIEKKQTQPKKSSINNYTDTNYTDYSALEEELLNDFLNDV